ncbi:type II toxin-antitoxin system VapC family toxin [Brevifollis gellanilyticus]|uniref:PIN domain-containing protein n=1 Tax=Brevifollis gellanilyticus TaxID=748831 RepID=A0A512M9S7_9BACT|nr:type II toxin-antitoxin system VapC family toxin [Brevifollis gellanilyticus]GEP43482.1 hypothetical protein BGE01nite_27730 [Brevifollis gellanilyticus]
MIRAYYDVSYLMKLQCSEHGSTEVGLHVRTMDVIYCCMHGRAEFVSACHRKIREGAATPAQLEAFLAQMEADTAAGGLCWLPLTDSVIQRVEAAYRQATTATYLRAADAMHLACAAENQFTEIYSNDRHLLAAAPLFGLTGLNVIP